MKHLILILLLNISISGCSEEKTEVQNTSIYGTWQLVQSYVTDGVNGNWEQIENGYQYEILPSNRFISNQFRECTEGTFVLKDSEITFDYECEGFTTGIETPAGSFTYQYSFDNGKLLLTPTYLNCDEGCGHKFEKIAEIQTGE
jgi:hypothetical protein